MGRENTKTLTQSNHQEFYGAWTEIDYRFEALWETVILREHTGKHWL